MALYGIDTGQMAGVTDATLRSWHGVCPKLLMMPSRAFRSVSLAMASRSTAPADKTKGFVLFKIATRGALLLYVDK